MAITAHSLAQRFVGIQEVAGATSNPMVLAMLQLDNKWVVDDDTPWCSAFVNYICWLARLPRSKDLAARSWLLIGKGIELKSATADLSDVVVLQRGEGKQPGADVIKAPGHVGFYSGRSTDGKFVEILGGNQGNSVSIQRFPIERVLSVRRLV